MILVIKLEEKGQFERSLFRHENYIETHKKNTFIYIYVIFVIEY